LTALQQIELLLQNQRKEYKLEVDNLLVSLKEIYKYREMLKNLVRKELRTRYKGSVLGFLWTFINPLLQLLVYTVIFSTVMRINIDRFYIFMFVALLPWIFFSTSVQSSSSTIISNKDLIKKIYFPRVVLPVSVVISGLMNMIFSFAIVFPALIISGIGITPAVIYLPIVMIAALIMTLGFSVLFSGLNVYFRDLEHILGIVIMAWFYFTPIVYPVEMIPESFLRLFFLNPITPIILGFRDILYYGIAPNFAMLGINMILGLILLVFAFMVFQNLQKNFAEEI
jgi:lipopolysaccharide transport system permease protein